MDTVSLPIGHTPNWVHQMPTQYPKICLFLLNPNTIRRDLYMLHNNWAEVQVIRVPVIAVTVQGNVEILC